MRSNKKTFGVNAAGTWALITLPPCLVISLALGSGEKIVETVGRNCTLVLKEQRGGFPWLEQDMKPEQFPLGLLPLWDNLESGPLVLLLPILTYEMFWSLFIFILFCFFFLFKIPRFSWTWALPENRSLHSLYYVHKLVIYIDLHMIGA